MLIIGLTGSIGMGKSALASIFRARGIAVCDADREVHKLYDGPAAATIETEFPGTTRDGKVDRALLAASLGGDPERFRRLERIIHPLVREAERRFLADEARRGAKLAVLEIPLLFETGGERTVDVTLVASANSETQRRRVLERPGMTAERFEALLARQMADAEKRRRADFVVDTNGSLADTEAQVDGIVRQLATREGRAFRQHWA